MSSSYHRAFSVSRHVQFLGALAGAAAAQRGPLWWVAHHREHHRFTDEIGDPHSPVVDSFLYSHVLWIFQPQNAATKIELVPDLASFSELRLIDRFEHVVPGVFAALMFAVGSALGHVDPALHTSGLQLLEWGFVLPTIVLYHSTFGRASVRATSLRHPRRQPQQLGRRAVGLWRGVAQQSPPLPDQCTPRHRPLRDRSHLVGDPRDAVASSRNFTTRFSRVDKRA